MRQPLEVLTACRLSGTLEQARHRGNGFINFWLRFAEFYDSTQETTPNVMKKVEEPYHMTFLYHVKAARILPRC
jgi:hypothetical protein